MIQVIQPAAAIDTSTVRITGRTRPSRNFSRNATAGVNRNVKVKANASGIRISRAKIERRDDGKHQNNSSDVGVPWAPPQHAHGRAESLPNSIGATPCLLVRLLA